MNTIDCPKCDHQHEPCGNHEDDERMWVCEMCGFKFNVEIEYSPDYSVSCSKHNFPEPMYHATSSGRRIFGSFCIYCEHFKKIDR